MTAPPLLHLRCIGHGVEERSHAMRQGQCIEIPLGSTHLGLCDKEFPDHRAKLCDVTMMRERGILFVGQNQVRSQQALSENEKESFCPMNGPEVSELITRHLRDFQPGVICSAL